MKKFFSIVVIIFALAILGLVGYASYDYLQKKNSLQFTPIPTPEITPGLDANASTTDSVASTTDLTVISTVDISGWKTYKNQEFGYDIKYPKDLIVNYDSTKLILAFPKKNYFSWPLQDDVKLTVTASSTCASDLLDVGSGIKPKKSLITIDGRDFTLNRVDDVAAGNRFLTATYEIRRNSLCYSFVYSSRGANGAGLYVDDPSLISKYDKDHVVNSGMVDAIVIGILSSFMLN